MLNVVVDRVATFALQFLSFLFRLFPERVGISLLTLLLKIAGIFAKKYERISLKNIEIAFPELTPEKRSELFEQHIRDFAKLLYDVLTLRKYDKKWAEECIEFPAREEYETLRKESESGVLIGTGHLGSFELLAHGAALLGLPLSYVIRNFPLPTLDEWWCSERERSGNTVINRKGAYKEIIRTLKSGRDVGVLFDQNVTRNHAVFVPWFSLEAATTKALALAVLQVKCPLVIASLCYRGDGQYELLYERCPVEEIVQSQELSKEEKVERITELASASFVKMISKYPTQWFWMHRRWKTRPIEGDLDYSS